jgi:polysaccharide export outer membrane protein
VAALGGCSALPSTGPSALAVMQSGADLTTAAVPTPDGPPAAAADYLIIPLDEPIVQVIGPWRPRDFADRFTIGSGPRSQPLGIGDVLDVRILEAGDNGLFANTQTRGTQFSAQIDETGDIFVPFVGRVKAAGRTVETLRSSLQQSLQDKAIQPQVMVAVTSFQANAAVVVGDVFKPARYPLNVGGTRLLDMVAIAGGSRYATYETMVTLKRGKESASVLLEDLFAIPANNVYLRPDDEILLTFAPQTYSILGAVTEQREIKFETKSVTLAEAVARAGGLNTLESDASGIFLFRYENPGLVHRIRPEFTLNPQPVPVVYRLDMKSPKSFFLARSMRVRDKDIVYVAAAPATELQKFLVIVNGVTSAWRGAQIIQQN